MKMKRFLSIILSACIMLSLMPMGTLAACAHDYVGEVYPASCTEDGFTLYTCSLCGDAYVGDEVAAFGHLDFVDGFCTLCGKYEEPELNANVYEIFNAGQLYWFAEQVNSGKTSINGKLMADIVVNENVLTAEGELNGDGSNFRVWTPIGNSSREYTGTFEGNGKTVSGLYFNDSSKHYVGLCGYVGSGGRVQNVYMVGSYMKGSNCVGGVVGINYYGTVSNSHNTGSVIGSGSYIGGVVGDNYYGDVSNSYNIGRVSSIGSGSYIGGVVGLNTGNSAKVINCYNKGSVSGYTNIGGVMGYNKFGIVSNCYNTGSIRGYTNTGGVAGNNYYGTVSESYNTGSVSGGSYVGGVAGRNENNSVVSNSYNVGIVSGSGNNVGGVVGYNYSRSAKVTYCHNTGSVSGSGDNIGGVVGFNVYGTVSSCYNIGSLSGSSCVGGVVGNNSKSVSNCYNDGSVSGRLYVGGVVGQNSETSGTSTNCFYRTGCAKDGDNKIQFGIGCETKGSNVRDIKGVTTGKSVDAFTSGEVSYLLQGDQAEQIWGQKIGEEKYPVLFGEKVYQITDGKTILGYSNVEGQLPESGVTVSGNVTSYLEGDVTVELVQNGEVAYSITVSGSEYAIEGVVAGDYTLRVTKANHAPMEFAITVGDGAVTQDATICPVGDVSGDGVVNIKDFQRLLRHVNKTNPLEDYDLACGDVTGDGVCNIKDFQRLLRHVNKTNPLF